MAQGAEMQVLDRSLLIVIDMNESRLETIEQIREFLAGTADVTQLARQRRTERSSAVR
jgi:hypothetical protein